jgi:UDP-GlcNAc:undecaprenyl-phosphate/decaprenyl-phosphate GlcNAc-1-phosphate transferase
LRSAPPGGAKRGDRTSHRGERVSLLEGPAVAGAAAFAAATAPGVPPRHRAAGAVAAAGASCFGTVDDLLEQGSAKGLRGHLRELARGRLTTGGLKILGLGAVGVTAATFLTEPSGGQGRGPLRRARRARDVAVGGALIAGTANLLNLLDLRPGRALKVALVAGGLGATGATCRAGNGDQGPATAAALCAASAGPAVALIEEDLGERAMLGDTGANAVGALLGTALVAGTGRRTRLAALGGVVALTLASERWSFTRVIERTPVLREFDALGRRPR